MTGTSGISILGSPASPIHWPGDLTNIRVYEEPAKQDDPYFSLYVDLRQSVLATSVCVVRPGTNFDHNTRTLDHQTEHNVEHTFNRREQYQWARRLCLISVLYDPVVFPDHCSEHYKAGAQRQRVPQRRRKETSRMHSLRCLEPSSKR